MGPFQGGVFDKRLDGGRAGADVTVSEQAIRAQTTAGEVYELPLGECQLELGGASGRMWFCRTGDRRVTVFSEAPGFAEALAAQAPLADAVKALRRHKRAEARRGGLFLLTALCMLGALVAAAYFGLEYAGRAAVGALPKEADEKIGRMAVASMDLGGPVVEDRVVREGVETLVARLAKAAPGQFDFHVRVIDADTVNAFALPGGEVVVYTGLLARADHADEVAAVLAHEIAHVTLRHGIERIAQSLGIAGAVELLLGDLGGLSALAIELMREGALTSYGRDQERAADEQGVQILRRAGLDPLALARMFEHLQAAEQAEEPQLPRTLAWLSSHPALSERIAHIKVLVDAQPVTAPRPLAVDWSDIRARIGAPLLPSAGDVGREGATGPDDGPGAGAPDLDGQRARAERNAERGVHGK